MYASTPLIIFLVVSRKYGNMSAREIFQLAGFSKSFEGLGRGSGLRAWVLGFRA